MPIFGWIRDALGVRKDHIETKKVKLETNKLENEERERDRRIKLASMDDIEKYDPIYRTLRDRDLKNREGMRKEELKSHDWLTEKRKGAGKGTGCLVSLFLLAVLTAIFLILR